MGEFEAKTTVNVYGNKIYVCIKSSNLWIMQLWSLN